MDAKETEGQSPASVKKHLVILNGVFNEAIKMQEMTYNPCAMITPSRGEKFCGHSYTAEEARQLLVAVEGDPVEPAVYLGLYLGLRRSEVAGLRWMDVDFDNNQVHALKSGEQNGYCADNRFHSHGSGIGICVDLVFQQSI